MIFEAFSCSFLYNYFENLVAAPDDMSRKPDSFLFKGSKGLIGMVCQINSKCEVCVCVCVWWPNYSDINEIEVADDLWDAGNDWAVASRVVIEFEKGCGHQLVVPRDREERLLGQRHQEQTFVLLGVRAVGRDVGVLRGLEIGTPPVGNNLLEMKGL